MKKEGIPWKCTDCGAVVHLSNWRALEKVKKIGKCQGCRARETFEKKPELMAVFVDFWMRKDGFPESASWQPVAAEHGYLAIAA